MGKRLLITEEEKNRIKSLYETTTPPPSESVLVANKNPFGYLAENIVKDKTISEYKGNLKDGDLFFVIDEPKIKKWAIDIINKNLKDKTIRLYDNNKEDKVITIPEFVKIGLNTYMLYAPKDKMNYCYTYAEISSHGDVISLSSNGEIKTYRVGRRSFPDEHITTEANLYKTDITTTNSIGNMMKPILTWKMVPDEFFEIRKVEKQKTDFK
jgi:hypothetical protein